MYFLLNIELIMKVIIIKLSNSQATRIYYIIKKVLIDIAQRCSEKVEPKLYKKT